MDSHMIKQAINTSFLFSLHMRKKNTKFVGQFVDHFSRQYS